MANERSDATRTGAGTWNVRWDDSNLRNAYANVCNVSSTREEAVLAFGINQAWERGQQALRLYRDVR